MLFSTELVQHLVIELTELSKLNTQSLHKLIYHLKIPGDAVPRVIAKTIADKTNLEETKTQLPGRLAYGIVDDCLNLYDPDQRIEQQTRLCRQVNRIRLRLLELEHSEKVIDSFEHKLSQLIFAATSASDLALTENTLSRAELGILVEQLLWAMVEQTELTKLLLERVTSRLRASERSVFSVRVAESIREGLHTQPWDDSTAPEKLCRLDEPVRFRLSLCKHPSFAEAAWDMLEQVSSTEPDQPTVWV